jgi:hypothetical protein
MKQPKSENEKVVKRGVSLRPEQYQRMGQHIDLTRIGPFSQFIQDAVTEKLDRIEKQSKPENELLAS